MKRGLFHLVCMLVFGISTPSFACRGILAELSKSKRNLSAHLYEALLEADGNAVNQAFEEVPEQTFLHLYNFCQDGDWPSESRNLAERILFEWAKRQPRLRVWYRRQLVKMAESLIDDYLAAQALRVAHLSLAETTVLTSGPGAVGEVGSENELNRMSLARDSYQLLHDLDKAVYLRKVRELLDLYDTIYYEFDPESPAYRLLDNIRSTVATFANNETDSSIAVAVLGILSQERSRMHLALEYVGKLSNGHSSVRPNNGTLQSEWDRCIDRMNGFLDEMITPGVAARAMNSPEFYYTLCSVPSGIALLRSWKSNNAAQADIANRINDILKKAQARPVTPLEYYGVMASLLELYNRSRERKSFSDQVNSSLEKLFIKLAQDAKGMEFQVYRRTVGSPYESPSTFNLLFHLLTYMGVWPRTWNQLRQSEDVNRLMTEIASRVDEGGTEQMDNGTIYGSRTVERARALLQYPKN